MINICVKIIADSAQRCASYRMRLIACSTWNHLSTENYKIIAKSALSLQRWLKPTTKKTSEKQTGLSYFVYKCEMKAANSQQSNYTCVHAR